MEVVSSFHGYAHVFVPMFWQLRPSAPCCAKICQCETWGRINSFAGCWLLVLGWVGGPNTSHPLTPGPVGKQITDVASLVHAKYALLFDSAPKNGISPQNAADLGHTKHAEVEGICDWAYTTKLCC